MEIQIEFQDEIAIITLIGRFDFASSEIASTKLMQTVEEKRNIIIDMSRCDYVSSSGLRALLLIGKRVKQVGEKIALANLTYDVQDVMEMTGFGTIFKCCDDVESAKEYIVSGEK